MEYLSRNQSAPPQADDAYDEENVINSIIPHYKFMAKYGRLSNQLDQSQIAKLYNEPKHSKTREQTVIACLYQLSISCVNLVTTRYNSNMDVGTIHNLESASPSAETRNLIARWREIFKPDIYRQSGGRRKQDHEPKFLRNERKIIE